MVENTSDEIRPAIYCIKCRYVLNGLPLHRCPECGTEYDPHDESTFWRPGREKWWAIRWEVFAALIGAIAFVLVLRACPAYWHFYPVRIMLICTTAGFTLGFSVSASRRGTILSRGLGVLQLFVYLHLLLCWPHL